jgi:hypothetical protein
MKKIVYIVTNRDSNEFYGLNLDGNLIFTTDYSKALHFNSEDEILAYDLNGFSFPVSCKIDSFIVNA